MIEEFVAAVNREAVTMRTVSVVPVILFFALPACSTQHLNLSMQVPAATNLKAKGVQSLAVTTFDGPGDSGKNAAELLTAKLVEGGHFKVVEREKLLALEDEQILGMTGVVDERMAAKAGKILGVDALVLGKVMPHPDHGNIAISYRVVRTETGEILAARQVAAGNPEGGRVVRRGFRMDEGESAERRSKLMHNVVAKVAAGIQPHPAKVEREFENGGWLFGDADVQQGIEYLKAGRLEDAVTQWETIVKRDPGNSAAWYNLGIAYELLHEFDKAEQAYRAAEKITPKARYIEAVGHARTALENHRKLEEEQ